VAAAEATAEAAALHYVSDATPGLRRIRTGRGFRYVGPDGSPVRDFMTRRRIGALAVPPAWTDVWICASPNGHIQAVGRDRRGRKQYRYHARWRECRDATKYARVTSFGARLPGIRRQVARDLARRGLPREKIVAAVVRLLDRSLIRVGNAEYAEANGSFGLTTLRTRHVTIEGSSLRFEFRGKGGRRHVVDVSDRRLARIVRQCQELPGHELFQCVASDGRLQAIGSTDVNAYLRRVAGEAFTAKDFRTWAGTVLAASALRGQPFESESEARGKVARAIGSVAQRLGNTPAVCRRCYVHPLVVETYLDGGLARRVAGGPQEEETRTGLGRDEAAILRLLRAHEAGSRADGRAALPMVRPGPGEAAADVTPSRRPPRPRASDRRIAGDARRPQEALSGSVERR
jgi:DNA topoisomerase-1